MTQSEVDVDTIEIDTSELDFSAIEAKYEVEEENIFDAVLLVVNIPVVDKARESKLLTVMNKVLGKFGKIKENGVYMPMYEDQSSSKSMSKGFLFVEYETPEIANAARRQIDGFRLDAKHTFLAIKLEDYERYLNLSDKFTPPEKEEYKERPDLHNWLVDPDGRDQFFVLADEEVSILWNSRAEDPEEEFARPNWTDSYLLWSPRGSYLATVHRQGIALWGSKSWERIVRFAHPNVKYLSFSPLENYCVTFSPESPKDKGDNLRVWDVRSGKLLRAFSGLEEDWPIFKWSPNDKYLAKASKESLMIYELPSMTLLGNKSIKVDSASDVSWSPSGDLIAFWTPEANNSPARVTILAVPSKDIVRTKNLFKVNCCKLFWSDTGDYLSVTVERVTKTKKTTFTNIEIFCVKEKDVPIEVYEGLKERTVGNICWEPDSDRFAMLSHEAVRSYFGLYKMEKTELKLLFEVESKSSELLWSPRGRFLAMRNPQSEIQFWDADDQTVLSTITHFNATDMEWDPSGRFFLTSVSYWRVPTENGMCLWDLQGQQLFKKLIPRFKQVSWRPRPPSLLSKEQMKNIRKNLKKYSKDFEAADSKLLDKTALEALARRRKLRDEWIEWRKVCQERSQKDRDQRAILRGSAEDPIYSDDENMGEEEDFDEIVEEIIEESEEIVE